MKKLIALTLFAAGLAGCCLCPCGPRPAAVAVSPDGQNEIRLYVDPLGYEVLRDDRVLVARTDIGLKVNGACLAAGAKDPKVTAAQIRGTEPAPVYKKAVLDFARNDAFADFGAWGVRLTARNDGVAYRFETKMPGTIKVNCEKATLKVPCPKAPCQVYRTGSFGCEEQVVASLEAGQVTTTDKGPEKMVYLPFVYKMGETTVAMTESDVYDYPILNLKRCDGAEGVLFGSTFAKWPTAFVNNSKQDMAKGAKRERHWHVKASADYLVETAGTRTFPWRTFILAQNPAELATADIVRALARPAAAGQDFSWVKPGKVAWDWWNDWNLEGPHITFKPGCNTKSYEYYIDFAAKTGVEYVIFDEGWSKKLDIWNFHPEVDVPHLIDYANKKGVGIILWMAWAQVYGDEERVASHFAKLGAKGFKVDFMDRGDADVERFLWKFAEACRKNKMLVDYHGAHRPTGMSRAYPNVLNFEGVHGLEMMKFYHGEDILANDVNIVFSRMAAGPMDYTPGAMINLAPDKYPTIKEDKKRVFFHRPGSKGTRARQMAMMALYEAPLQMLCDSPTNYEKNMESFAFMAATPVTWDDTVALPGTCPRKLAALARRKGNVWYAAGITTAEARDYVLDTAFLGAGTWKAEIFRDAPESNVQSEKYVHETLTVKAGDKMTVKMAPGGGFVVKFAR